MILNQSKFVTAKSCWKRAFNLYHRELGVARTPQLVDGSALHAGLAHFLAHKDGTAAFEAARAEYDKEIAQSTIPPEQLYLIESNWSLVETMLERVMREQHDWTVIQPECSFEVPLAGSWHNCIFKHYIYTPPSGDPIEVFNDKPHTYAWQPDGPPAEAIASHQIHSPHPNGPDPTCRCWQPHYLHGRTDALVNWKNTLWLVDWKTTSILGDQFWSAWQLDIQPTAYIYGIFNSLKIRPRGVIIGAIYRPSDAQVASWNKKRKDPREAKSAIDYIQFEREAFLRTEQDLDRFEREMVDFCDEWELRITRGWFGMTPTKGACRNYNRVCDYYTMCTSHDMDRSGLVEIEVPAKGEEPKP